MTIDKKQFTEDALDLFKTRYSCSEAIVHAANKTLNLGLNDTAIKMATGFSAGLGARCCCGALAGSVMAVSALKGRTAPDESAKEIHELSKELHDKFIEKNRSACCRILTKSFTDWGSSERRKHCEQFVKSAAETLADVVERI